MTDLNRANLIRERDWMRRCAGDTTRPAAERAMWTERADEIDAHLARTEDVAETTDDDVALWEETR